MIVQAGFVYINMDKVNDFRVVYRDRNHIMDKLLPWIIVFCTDRDEVELCCESIEHARIVIDRITDGLTDGRALMCVSGFCETPIGAMNKKMINESQKL